MALLVNCVGSVLNLEPLTDEDLSFNTSMVIILGAVFSTNALLIYVASRRRNWARIMLLLLTIAGLSLYVIWPTDFFSDPWWSWVPTGLATVLEVAALGMLFLGDGAKWYSNRATA